MMAEDGEELTLYQVTYKRPTWPFEDWRYDVLTKSTTATQPSGKGCAVWYTQDESDTIAEVLKVDSINEDYPFRKQRLSASLQKALKLSSKNPEKSTKSRLSDSSRDIYSLDKVALGKKFFHVLVNMTLPEYCDQTYALRVEILEILQATGKYLQQNCDLFENCDIIPLGGMADGTKIFTSEEVDFLITLPALRESIEHVEICDESDLIPVIHLKTREDKQEVNLQKRMSADLEGALEQNMPSDCELGSVTRSSDGRTRKVTLRVKMADSADATVTFTVSFVIPINRQCLSTSGDESHPDKITKVPLQNYTLSYLKERDSQIYAILADDKLKSCTVCIDVDMANIVTKDFKSTGVAHTFLLAKQTIAIFFPQVFQDKTWKTMVPSYVILNLVMYLCAYRKSARLWTPSRVHERLVEVLLLLERCAEDEAVNLFLLPGMAALPLYSSNAYYFEPNKSRFVCQDESFTTETFECRVLDKGVIAAFSKHADLTTYLVPYFSKLRNNEWTFPDKIAELVSVLEEIFQCKVPTMWHDGRMSSIDTDSTVLPAPKENRRVSVRKARASLRQAQQTAMADKSSQSESSDATPKATKRPKSANSSMSSKTSKSAPSKPKIKAKVLEVPKRNSKTPPKMPPKPSPKPSPKLSPKISQKPPFKASEAQPEVRKTANGKVSPARKRMPRGKDCCPVQ